jgi:hypothetical protein
MIFLARVQCAERIEIEPTNLWDRISSEQPSNFLQTGKIFNPQPVGLCFFQARLGTRSQVLGALQVNLAISLNVLGRLNHSAWP